MIDNFHERVKIFQQAFSSKAQLAFFPISADLQYLTGISRDMPTFGAIRHPGSWIEGLWLVAGRDPILVLTRMTADFNPPGGVAETLVLGDHDDPDVLLKTIVERFKAGGTKTISVGERTSGETFIHLQRMFPGAVFCSGTEMLAVQRAVKNEAEISAMKHAGKMTEKAFQDVVAVLKHGMTELEVILEVDYQLRSHGSIGPSFNTALYVVGPSHELIFNQPDKTLQRVLSPPVSILFDFGAIYDGYCYDFGRTVAFGEPSDELVRAHQLVMEAQQAGIRSMVAGKATAEEVDRAARTVIINAGKGDTFRHRLGHGIGLDVHEPPFLTRGDDTVLRSGMLFTVEPSVLVPFSASARVEDVVLVGEQGGIPLTSNFQSLIVIE